MWVYEVYLVARGDSNFKRRELIGILPERRDHDLLNEAMKWARKLFTPLVGNMKKIHIEAKEIAGEVFIRGEDGNEQAAEEHVSLDNEHFESNCRTI
jgi:hypothetical protein